MSSLIHYQTLFLQYLQAQKLCIVFYIAILSFIAGCENQPQNDPTNSLPMVNAIWNEDTSTLKVSGNITSNDMSVEIHDAADQSLLGTALVKGDGSWAAISSIPACEIHISTSDGPTTFSVKNAPSNCTGSENYSRSLSGGGKILSEDDIPSTVLVVSNPNVLSAEPNAVILSPPQNISINVGQYVNFEAVAVGSTLSPPYSYFWNFGGVALNSTAQNPGLIKFDVPGTYFIQLFASDSLGIPDPTPAVRTITVNDPNAPISAIPTAIIVSPIRFNSSISINVGESLFFSGEADDDLSTSSFTYEWDFSGIYPNTFGANAGSIPFNQSGVFVVSLYVTNDLGLRCITPATVTVIVSATLGINQAPRGVITRPRNDVTINVGESLKFKAHGDDPDDNEPLLYSWDFQGAAPNIDYSLSKSIGDITFNNPGVYYIRMTTSDALGAVDPNPPIRVVTVKNNVIPPPQNVVLSTQITSPPFDLVINPGQSVFFSGQIVSTNNVIGPVQFYWNFGGVALDSNLQSPGSVSFPLPGQYFISFYALDGSGSILGQPAFRTVTVLDPSNIEANIISPVDRSVVSVGDTVNLVGRVINQSVYSNLDYNWTIRRTGSTTNFFTSSKLSPGSYIFQNSGDYIIEFKAIGLDNNLNPMLASKVESRITVVSPQLPSPSPANADAIVLPTTDKVIYAGTAIEFEALPISGINVTYNWDFNGVRADSNLRTPGFVTFSTPGTYYVTLNATSAQLNLFDQRMVMVLPQNPSTPPVPSPSPTTNNSDIEYPATDQTIYVGESVRFGARTATGTGIDYRWNFSGVRTSSTTRVPGEVKFSSPGTFIIELYVTRVVNGVTINTYDQRIISVLQQNLPVPPVSNLIPLGTGIVIPATDQLIRVGDTVDFEANSNFTSNVQYLWNFAGVRNDTGRPNPPPTQFDTAGTFIISVQISGSSNNGVPFSINDQRVITVLQPNAPPPVPPAPVVGSSLPNGVILEPTNNVVTINVGQSVNFSASGFDPLGLGLLGYQWSFGGALNNIVVQNPGAVTFDRVGTFVVTLLVKNAIGVYDPNPPTVVVIVTP